jgi:hypothetical protein
MVHARADAALGGAHSDLVRAPPLPDLLRSAALARSDHPEAIRLPGAVAAALLVALTALLARLHGLGPGHALLAAAFAFAFPLTQSGARLALGDPLGELFAALAVLFGLLALRRWGPPLSPEDPAAAALDDSARLPPVLYDSAPPFANPAPASGPSPAPPGPTEPPLPPSRLRTLTFALLALLALAGAVASAGLGFGALLPLAALALAAAPQPRPRLILLLALTAVALTLLHLIRGQGDGYIPLLGAALDLGLRGAPTARVFTDSLAELGHQLFPWLPLALLGALRPGAFAWPAHWFWAGLALHAAWSLLYGQGAIPLTIPAALCAVAGLRHLTDPAAHRAYRRLGLLLALGGVLVLAKDARRAPDPVAAPLAPSAHSVDASAHPGLAPLAQHAQLAFVVLLLAGVAGSQRRRLPPWLAPTVAAAALLFQGLRIGHHLLPQLSEQRSLQRPLARFAAWSAAGQLPPELAVFRVRDATLAIYGPPARPALLTREALRAWLDRPAPSAALCRASELASLYAAARAAARPFYVLDRGHREAILIANRLPEGATDHNPLLELLGDAAPPLENPTLVRFEDYLEVLGWEVSQPLIRGREATITLGLRVLRPLPADAQIITRLQRGHLSRINPLPHPFNEGLYPPNLWRPGDYIRERYRFDVPLLEILSGAHDLVIGVRLTGAKNLEISAPAGELGAHGVELRDRQRSLATLGSVSVW